IPASAPPSLRHSRRGRGKKKAPRRALSLITGSVLLPAPQEGQKRQHPDGRTAAFLLFLRRILRIVITRIVITRVAVTGVAVTGVTVSWIAIAGIAYTRILGARILVALIIGVRLRIDGARIRRIAAAYIGDALFRRGVRLRQHEAITHRLQLGV